MSYPTITAEQQAALDAIRRCKRKVSSLTGPAGTGKTTVIRELYDAFDRGPHSTCVVAAFTNAAAKVLRGKGISAATIHRQFYIPEEIRDTPTSKPKTVHTPVWKWLEWNSVDKLPVGKYQHVDTLIIDEASMVPTWMVNDLKAMSGRLIMVGDGNQLPPVGDRKNPRGYFNTLDHTAELTTVHRQAEGCPALAIATRLRNGEIDPLSREVVAQFSPTMGLRENIKQLDAAEKTWRVITFTNRTRHKLNSLVRGYYGYGNCLAPQPGERLISLDAYNDVIVNGTSLRVISSDQFPATLAELSQCLYPKITVEVEGDEELGRMTIHIDAIKYLAGFSSPEAAEARNKLINLENSASVAVLGSGVAVVNFGYAITCHKAQGSEFDHIFMVDERYIYNSIAQKEADKSLSDDPLTGIEAARRWAYTAMTRTRGALVVIPSRLIK